MRVLVVAATDFEIAPFAEKLREASEIHPRLKAYKYQRHDVHILISGVGMVATAAWCSQTLTQNPYDLALNLGLCGSFDPALELGQVVHVVSDLIAELGAEAREDFLTPQDWELFNESELPFDSGWLVNSASPRLTTLDDLIAVDGITVNTVHGNERSIATVMRHFHPQVESMEGAAFMYACLIHRVPFAQIRAVSNVVEERNREAWNLAGAIRNLSEVALKIVEEA